MKCNRIGVLLVGVNGCVGNTTIVGHRLITKGAKAKLGMITELSTFNKIDFLPLEDIVFGGWDIIGGSVYEAALKYKIIPKEMLDDHKDSLSCVNPFKGITTPFDHPELQKDYFHKTNSLLEAIDILISDIENFKYENNISKVIVIYVASATKNYEISSPHNELGKFENALKENSINEITTGMLYCYAALKANCSFIDFTPNITLETPCLIKFAEDLNLPVVGRDGSTGQTLIKSVLAEMLNIRNLRLSGWYSTNILGNNDGFILSHPDFNLAKISDKKSILPKILGYDEFEHQVIISYYKPRGDDKESWDNIDFQGFLGMNMSFSINWHGKDSILAAPLIIDLIRFVEYTMRNDKGGGLLKHLGIFFKNPLGIEERGFFQNWTKLKSHFNL